MESFSWVSEGPSPLKETQTVKNFFFEDDQVPGHHPRALNLAYRAAPTQRFNAGRRILSYFYLNFNLIFVHFFILGPYSDSRPLAPVNCPLIVYLAHVSSCVSLRFQVVSALAVILTEQPIGLTGGVCSSAPQRASIFPLDVTHTGESICVHERGSYPAGFGHTSTLGLFLTAHYWLTWNDHISNLYTTCARMTGILRRLDGSIPSSSMKKIYTAVIRPRIEYACAVWSGGPTHRLQRLQDSFSKRNGIMLPPLQKSFDYYTLVLLYRIHEKLAPDHLFSLLPSLISSTSGYSLRKHSYPVPFTKKSATVSIAFCPEQSFFGTHSPLMFNHLSL